MVTKAKAIVFVEYTGWNAIIPLSRYCLFILSFH